MIAGIVLAAGASSRMGRPKAALPFGDRGRTVLQRVVMSLLEAGVPKVAVVTGAHRAAVADALGGSDPRVTLVYNQGWRDGQLSSIVCGLDAVETPDLEAVVMNLVDVPLVLPSTIRLLLERWRTTRAPVVRPARGDRHGHPVLFDRGVFTELRAADRGVGAKAVVRAHAQQVLDVPVEDEGAFLDLDTPKDYDLALAALQRRARPSDD